MSKGEEKRPSYETRSVARTQEEVFSKRLLLARHGFEAECSGLFGRNAHLYSCLERSI